MEHSIISKRVSCDHCGKDMGWDFIHISEGSTVCRMKLNEKEDNVEVTDSSYSMLAGDFCDWVCYINHIIQISLMSDDNARRIGKGK
jgi:hypothetical protein